MFMLLIIIYCQELSELCVLFIIYSLEWWCRHQLSATDGGKWCVEECCAVFPCIISPWALNPFSLDIFLLGSCACDFDILLLLLSWSIWPWGGMLTQPRTPGDLSIRCRAVGQNLTQSRLIGRQRLTAVGLLLLRSHLTLDKKRELTFR